MNNTFDLANVPGAADLIAAARAGFAEDTGLMLKIARSGAVLARRREEAPSESTQEARSGPNLPAPYECPQNHSHGSDSKCLTLHRCTCEECSSAEQMRLHDMRQRGTETQEVRPVTTSWGPAKTAHLPAKVRRPERLNNNPQRTEPARSNVVDPDAVGKDGKSIHGRSAGYERRGCRCGACRAWKSQANARTNARREANKNLHAAE